MGEHQDVACSALDIQRSKACGREPDPLVLNNIVHHDSIKFIIDL